MTAGDDAPPPAAAEQPPAQPAEAPAEAPAQSLPPPGDPSQVTSENAHLWQEWERQLEERGFENFSEQDWTNWLAWKNHTHQGDRFFTRTTEDGWTYNQSNITGGFQTMAELASALNVNEQVIRDLYARGYTFHRGVADDTIRVKTPTDRAGSGLKRWELFQETPTYQEIDRRIGTQRGDDPNRAPTLEELQELFGQHGVEAPTFDTDAIEELIGRNREAAALQKAQSIQALMERGARAGVAPEALSGMVAQASHAANVAQNQEEAKLRLAQAQTQFQARMREYENKREEALRLLDQATDARTRAFAAEQARRMAILQSELQREYAAYQQQLQAATSGDIWAGVLGGLGAVGGAIIGGPAGAAAGGLLGSSVGAAAFG